MPEKVSHRNLKNAEKDHCRAVTFMLRFVRLNVLSEAFLHKNMRDDVKHFYNVDFLRKGDENVYMISNRDRRTILKHDVREEDIVEDSPYRNISQTALNKALLLS